MLVRTVPPLPPSTPADGGTSPSFAPRRRNEVEKCMVDIVSVLLLRANLIFIFVVSFVRPLCGAPVVLLACGQRFLVLTARRSAFQPRDCPARKEAGSADTHLRITLIAILHRSPLTGQHTSAARLSMVENLSRWAYGLLARPVRLDRSPHRVTVSWQFVVCRLLDPLSSVTGGTEAEAALRAERKRLCSHDSLRQRFSMIQLAAT